MIPSRDISLSSTPQETRGVDNGHPLLEATAATWGTPREAACPEGLDGFLEPQMRAEMEAIRAIKPVYTFT